jgi:hypothetical protein
MLLKAGSFLSYSSISIKNVGNVKLETQQYCLKYLRDITTDNDTLRKELTKHSIYMKNKCINTIDIPAMPINKNITELVIASGSYLSVKELDLSSMNNLKDITIGKHSFANCSRFVLRNMYNLRKVRIESYCFSPLRSNHYNKVFDLNEYINTQFADACYVDMLENKNHAYLPDESDESEVSSDDYTMDANINERANATVNNHTNAIITAHVAHTTNSHNDEEDFIREDEMGMDSYDSNEEYDDSNGSDTDYNRFFELPDDDDDDDDDDFDPYPDPISNLNQSDLIHTYFMFSADDIACDNATTLEESYSGECIIENCNQLFDIDIKPYSFTCFKKLQISRILFYVSFKNR